MGDTRYLGFVVPGFQDEGVEELPIGHAHPAPDAPGISPESRRLVGAAQGLGWDTGIFHSGDGFMDYLVWRAVSAPYEVPAHMASLVADPVAGPEMITLGISYETFFISPHPPGPEWNPDELGGVHMLVDDPACQQIQDAWTAQELFALRPDMAALGEELTGIAYAMRVQAFEGIEPGSGRSITDTMFEL